MIYLTSVKNKKTKDEINELVGRAFGLWERFKKKGIGSPKFKIVTYSNDFKPFFLEHDNQVKQANIELRPKGILIHFKKGNDVYTWPIPYYKLTIYRTEHFRFFADNHSISFDKKFMDFNYSKFITKLLGEKSQYLNQNFSLQ